MAINTINLCQTRKAVTREGHTGANAHFILPFYEESGGIWFAGGKKATFPNTEIPQFQGLSLHGTKKFASYQKDCCSCLGA